MSINDERQRRILTTHVGSLPRPQALSDMMADGIMSGAGYDRGVVDASKDVVRRRPSAASDIVDDGEQSKPASSSTSTSAFPAWSRAPTIRPSSTPARSGKFPEFYEHGHSGSRPPCGCAPDRSNTPARLASRPISRT
jgi:5-methyltetrahydropteroyltriglutamate--homocysteine methyltransferase